MLRVYTAAHEADGIEEVTSLDQLRLNYSTLVNCDPARDMILAEVEGELVAYARVFWNDLVEGGRSYENFGFVHPDWRRRGIGGAMHRHNEQRLREIAEEHVDVAPKWFGSEGVDADPGNTALLRGDGYTPARYFYEMVAPTLDGLVAPPMPDGIELRPVTRDQYRTIWLASAEAFRDHWGEAEWTEEDWTRFDADPDNADPRFWRIGWDGEEVAGEVTTTVPAEENERHGRARVYVASVSVRRPWRRRGLARALLARSLVAARGAGFTSASLGVDTDSPTGATALYESLGFAARQDVYQLAQADVAVLRYCGGRCRTRGWVVQAQLLDAVPIGVIFVALVAITTLAYLGGYRIGLWHQARTPDEKEGPTGALVASLLATLAFLVAVTMSMASDRFDTRRGLVLEEANAIGTTYLRAGFLPAPNDEAVRTLLREYVPLRIARADLADLARSIERSEEIQDAVWAITEEVAETEGGSETFSLYVSSLNEMIDLHTKRVVAGVYARVPESVVYFLIIGSTLALVMTGYGAGLTGRRSLFSALAFVIVFSGVITLIIDLDQSRSGFLQVSQQALIDLQESLGPP